MTEQQDPGSLRTTTAGTADDHPGYPGEHLGLPETGPGSAASLARRLGALIVDWIVSTVVVLALIRPPYADLSYWTLAVFAAQDVILTAVTGLTVGKLLLRIRVIRLDGRLVGPGWAFVRTLLLMLIAPPLIVDSDVRGMHDRGSNTAVVRL